MLICLIQLGWDLFLELEVRCPLNSMSPVVDKYKIGWGGNHKAKWILASPHLSGTHFPTGHAKRLFLM